MPSASGLEAMVDSGTVADTATAGLVVDTATAGLVADTAEAGTAVADTETVMTVSFNTIGFFGTFVPIKLTLYAMY